VLLLPLRHVTQSPTSAHHICPSFPQQPAAVTLHKMYNVIILAACKMLMKTANVIAGQQYYTVLLAI